MKKRFLSAALLAAVSAGYVLGGTTLSLNAETPSRGDVNGDGILNILDLVDLKSLLLGYDIQKVPEEPVSLEAEIYRFGEYFENDTYNDDILSSVAYSSEDIDAFLKKALIDRNTITDSEGYDPVNICPDEADFENNVYLIFTADGSAYGAGAASVILNSSSVDINVSYRVNMTRKFLFMVKIPKDIYHNQKINIENPGIPYEPDEPVPCKPVIYLYPEETTDINVRLNINSGGALTYTYPLYNGITGWNVTADPDSVLHDKSGREYSYLFWEGVSDQKWDMTNGFVVKGSDTVSFLQEKLEYLGLTPKEYNEFIVYWMPRMQNNKYNLITFQTDRYEEYAGLEITPEPDSIQRVFMAYEPLDEYIEIPEQKLDSFERHGYSVIEWGGVEITDSSYTIR